MPQLLQEVSRDEPITAESYNRLVRAINYICNLTVDAPLSLTRDASGMSLRLSEWPQIKHVITDENIDVDDTGKTVNVLDHNGTDFVDTQGSGYATQQITSAVDRQDAGVWIQDERRVAYYDPQTGKTLLIDGPGPHLAKVLTEISARSGTTIGTGSVRIQKLTGTTLGTAGAANLTVKNVFSNTFPVDDFVEVIFHHQSRMWFVVSGAGTDSGKVKVDAADTLDYLESQFSDTGESYDVNTDGPPIETQKVVVSGSDDAIRLFLPFDQITGGTPNTLRVLTMSASNVLQWADTDTC